MSGKLPKIIYTDFDPKLLSKTVSNCLNQNNTIILAAPPEQQHQNGLIERMWQILSQMARVYVYDKLMSRSFWFWSMHHASRIQNIFPLKFNNTLTTPHELVYKSKPDYRQLFRLLSTAFSPIQRTVQRPGPTFNPIQWLASLLDGAKIVYFLPI